MEGPTMKPWQEFSGLVQIHMMHGKTAEEACEIAWEQAIDNAGYITPDQLTLAAIYELQEWQNAETVQWQVQEIVDTAINALLHKVGVEFNRESLQ